MQFSSPTQKLVTLLDIYHNDIQADALRLQQSINEAHQLIHQLKHEIETDMLEEEKTARETCWPGL
jgi:hypothetical protein